MQVFTQFTTEENSIQICNSQKEVDLSPLYTDNCFSRKINAGSFFHIHHKWINLICNYKPIEILILSLSEKSVKFFIINVDETNKHTVYWHYCYELNIRLEPILFFHYVNNFCKIKWFSRPQCWRIKKCNSTKTRKNNFCFFLLNIPVIFART